jgi:serine kinase of HPr protein (carbohydrate metabolism regulator)
MDRSKKNMGTLIEVNTMGTLIEGENGWGIV